MGAVGAERDLEPHEHLPCVFRVLGQACDDILLARHAGLGLADMAPYHLQFRLRRDHDGTYALSSHSDRSRQCACTLGYVLSLVAFS